MDDHTLRTSTPLTSGSGSQEIDGIDRLSLYAAYGTMSLVFLWFGGMKFTAYEAAAISGLIANSPFISLLGAIFSQRLLAGLIGTVEIIIAVLLAARFIAAKIAMIGAAGAVLTFLLTFSFFFSTPGVFVEEVGGLGISVMPGQFLLKDIALLALAIVLFNESRHAAGKS